MSIDHVDDLETDERWPLLVRFVRHGTSHAPYLLASLVITFFMRLLNQAPPVIVGATIDGLSDPSAYRLPLVPGAWVPDGAYAQLWFTAGILSALYVVGLVFGYAAQYLRNVFGIHLLYDLKMDAYETVQDLELAFFESQQTGEVLSILNNDVDQLETFYNYVLASLMLNGMNLVAMGIYMSLLNWQLTIVAFLLAPAFAFVNVRFHARIERVWSQVREAIGKLNARVQDNVGGMPVIKANTAEEFESGRVHDASRRTFDAYWDALTLMARFRPLTGLLSNGTFLATFLVGGYWVLRGPPGPLGGTLTAGNLVAFLMYTRGMSGNLASLSGHVERYKSSKASAKRLASIQRTDLTIDDPDDAVELEDVEGRVVADDVTFAYDDEPVIADASFAVDPGETVGVVGATGAGKSTLMKLLVRFYDVDEGAIRVDGHDVRDVTIRSLRDAIGYVAQEPYLFSGTVRENIAYGEPGATDEAIREASRVARAHEFVEQLEDGYDTEVGERGVKLSGGQRQRIAIARAIVRDAPILLFDEATSHVDNETEVLIQRRLERTVEDRTAFIVAHRLSTVRDADTILVLEDGEIVERGTHGELLERDGVYADLWRVQVGDVDSASSDHSPGS